MSNAETVYTARVAYPDYLERERTQSSSFPLWRQGSLATPSSGTFTLYDSGTTVLTTGAMAIAGGIATFEIQSTALPSTLSLGHGYREEWELTLPDTTTRTFRRDAAVVLHAPYPVVTDDDLEATYTDLARHRASGTTTWQGYREEAWARILGRLEAQGVFPDHIITPWSLREVHLELSYHLIALDFAKSQGGKWMELASNHKKEFELGWRRLSFVRATGDTGAADGTDLHSVTKGVTFTNAAPSTTWGGGFGV